MLLGGLLEFVAEPKTYFFSIPDIFFSEFPNICTVYLCIFLFNKFASPLRIAPLFICVTLVYIFSCLHWYVTGYIIRPHFRMNGDAAPIMSIWNYSVLLVWIFIKYALFGFSYYYATQNIKQQKRLLIIEKEKHEAEYAFLRAQINPHFLNNTLNFFYAKSFLVSRELANGIMILSDIMRYSLEIDKDDRTTLLDDEIAHIKNVININQLRFNHKLQIDFDIKGNTEHVRIIPLVLITMVENILKHGDCTDRLNPVYIILSISEHDQIIYFNASNKKKNGPKELLSGIGIENIKKRLAHHYVKDFTLNIKDSETDYSIELKLPILVEPIKNQPNLIIPKYSSNLA